MSDLSDKPRSESPVRKLGVMLLVGLVLGVVPGVLTYIEGSGSFESKGGELIPLSFPAVFLSSFASLSFAVVAILLFRRVRDLVLYKRKKGTWRNLMIQLALMIATGLSTVGMGPLETSVLTSILFATSHVVMAVNVFRLSWIVYLTKREKLFALVYAFLLFVVLTVINVLSRSGPVHQLLLFHSHPAQEFTGLILLFGNVYAGMAFVSRLVADTTLLAGRGRGWRSIKARQECQIGFEIQSPGILCFPQSRYIRLVGWEVPLQIKKS